LHHSICMQNEVKIISLSLSLWILILLTWILTILSLGMSRNRIAVSDKI
jgi:hypothetical protein